MSAAFVGQGGLVATGAAAQQATQRLQARDAARPRVALGHPGVERALLLVVALSAPAAASARISVERREKGGAPRNVTSAPPGTAGGSGTSSCDWTASVLEIFLDPRRERLSMLRKSVLPPVLSW